ncbi:uncharacterized protein K452DRAFT_255279 [Aplosporella prunicola CBS 121167]|uniref:Mitochondrial carrier n=1 Tax=Aplosporella prunicola CBS 121167 TaxID=1176127 RepID=A0A6A6B4K4_9PEZI|nr:uncharacterized protein K452DRAFT_255279 [Aplosporella prunicola CBS 121167]KAF2139139.1 hypothetical protein K452DRAFT_255279 [Aplosporella prunicola CBS 121167]
MAHVYNSQLDAFTLYHQVQEEKKPHSSIGPALPALGHATSGAIGSALAHLAIYPLDLIITRLQVQSQFKSSAEDGDDDEYADVVDAIKKIYAREGGLTAFYSGVGHDTAKSIADNFLFFLAYNFVREARQRARSDGKALPVLEEIAVGMLAGAFSKFWTTPVQNIVTRKQTASMVAARSKTSSVSPQLSTKDIALQIKDEKGLQGFWTGYSAQLILTINPALTFLLHETLLRTLVPKSRRADPGPRLTFLVAALSKAIASTITYPVSLAKTRAQVSSQSPASTADAEPLQEKASDAEAVKKARKASRATIFGSILELARREGVAGLYQGLGGEVLKGFFTHGLTMLLKERIHGVVIQLYFLVLKALKKYPSPHELAAQTVPEGFKEGFENVSTQVQDGFKAAAGQAQQGLQAGMESGREIVSEAQEGFKAGVESSREVASGAASHAHKAMEKGRAQVGDAYGKGKEWLRDNGDGQKD